MKIVLLIIILIIVFYLRQGRRILRICDDWHKTGAFLVSPWCAVLFPRHRRWPYDKDDLITHISRWTKGNYFYSFLIVFFWLPLIILTWLIFALKAVFS